MTFCCALRGVLILKWKKKEWLGKNYVGKTFPTCWRFPLRFTGIILNIYLNIPLTKKIQRFGKNNTNRTIIYLIFIINQMAKR